MRCRRSGLAGVLRGAPQAVERAVRCGGDGRHHRGQLRAEALAQPHLRARSAGIGAHAGQERLEHLSGGPQRGADLRLVGHAALVHPCQVRQAPLGELDAQRSDDRVLELVGLVDDQPGVLRQQGAPCLDVGAVEVCVHHDDVGLVRGRTSGLGPAVLGERAAGRAHALAGADRHHTPRLPARGLLQLGHVAALGGVGPVHQLLDLGQHLRVGQVRPAGRVVGAELQVLLLGAAAELDAHLVQRRRAQVVGASLQHGEAERAVERLGQERQVDVGQLVLEGLGRRDDHRPVVRTGCRDGGQQVRERLADARRALDRQVPLRAERGLHGTRHLDLRGAVLAVGDRRGDLREQVDRVGAVRRWHSSERRGEHRLDQVGPSASTVRPRAAR